MLLRENIPDTAQHFSADVDNVLFKAVIDAAVDAIVVTDEKGCIRLANPATERLFLYPVEELLGENINLLLPKPHHSLLNSYLRNNVLDSGERKDIGIAQEVSGRRRDGTTFPLSLCVAEVHPDKRQRYFAWNIHNLSKQKAIETALRESEQHLRDVTEAASDWTWEMDEQFRLTFISERFYELTGVSPEVVVGRTRWELAADVTDLELWNRHREDLQCHRPFRDFVYSPRFSAKPGRELYFKINGKPVIDEDGKFCGYRGTGTDVTERVMAKRALRESRRRLDTLMCNVPGMVYRCRGDRHRTMEFVSEGGQRLTGYRPEELMGEAGVKFAELIHADDRKAVWQEVRAALIEHRPFELTYRILTARGEEKWVWEHGREVYTDDGTLRAIEGLIVDISERRQTESALRALAGSTASGCSDDFVTNCVRELARTYGCKYAFIGVFADSTHTSIRTLAVWAGEAPAENLTYDLTDTPCQDILNYRIKIVPREATRHYPLDTLLKDLGVESYFGIPLVDSSGKAMGLVSVMDTRPMRPNPWTQPILGVFADRIARELERQQAEQKLRQREAYMRLTLENAPIGIASADLDGRLFNCNPAFASLLGYAPEELAGLRVDDITHPEDREKTRRHFEALVRGDIPSYELEKRYLRKGGDVIHVHARAGLVRDDKGRPMHVVGEVEDETERLRSAGELKRMRAYLKNIIDSMPSVLVGVDTEGRVTEWNRSAERSTGITPGNAVGRALPELLPQLAAHMRNVSEAIRRHEPIRTERMAINTDNKTRYADVMVYPLLANGAMGAVILMDDITERIRIEQMMVQTEKMLSVGGLAAGMAHEISNPLSIIMQSAQNVLRRLSKALPANRLTAEKLGLNLETLSDYLKARGITQFIEDIQEAGTRASRIVADMLAFSRRSTSQLTPNRLEEILETVVRLAASDYDLKKKYDFRRIEIVRDYDPGLGAVICERTQIEQVFLNIIRNAAQAMATTQTPPPPHITIRTCRDGDFARIEVEDNGPGMNAATLERAFEPFFTTKETGIGTGLGLSVSYFIITEQHKGSLKVTSREGEGCRFTILLPIAGKEET